MEGGRLQGRAESITVEFLKSSILNQKWALISPGDLMQIHVGQISDSAGMRYYSACIFWKNFSKYCCEQFWIKNHSLKYVSRNKFSGLSETESSEGHVKICISKFWFNITGMRLEILDFLQNPSSCCVKWCLWDPAHVSSKNSIKGTWSHCSDPLQMSWDVAIKAPPSMNTGCKILQPDIFKANNRHIFKEEGCLNITMCQYWFSSK